MSSLISLFGSECLHEFFTPHSNFTSAIMTEVKWGRSEFHIGRSYAIVNAI